MLDMIQSFLDLGSIVVLPILIFVFAIALGTPVSKAIKSGLTVGIGFIGLNLVIGLLGGSLGPAAQQMVEHLASIFTSLMLVGLLLRQSVMVLRLEVFLSQLRLA
ncbi:PTS system galactitol-specific IIC component [Vibrio variabilis]|uniref:PTS system galactitol-specific IIC component n=1 Tax=Vibrio variabilis TaxID=990271 RepID=A0ABQ0JHJ2_9VIBR|nr:PTS system galactitol-specific IIC component [Vibrio variabilis]